MARRLFSSLVLGICLLGALPLQAHAATPFFRNTFSLHGFDKAILLMLGYTTSTATVSYFEEIASITMDQQAEVQKYAPINCHPFYLVKDGKVAEAGYNCETFHCIGYLGTVPKQCRDREGNAFGGDVEISKRLDTPFQYPPHIPFTSYAEADRTPAMRARIADLARFRCQPFYVVSFDAVTGEGYHCDQIGVYPNFSGERTCIYDGEAKKFTCDIAERSNEFSIRYAALGGTGSLVSSSVMASSASSSAVTFSDVAPGQYGYTAIMSLAARGVVGGYPGGTFQPQRNLNRAEFVKMLIVGLHPEEAKKESKCFPDVNDQWFAQYVCAVKRLHWVSGYPDGRFVPARPIKREEALKVIMSSITANFSSDALLLPDVPANAWYAPYVRKAVELKIILEADFRPGIDANRADAAVWMYRADKYLHAR